MKKCFLSKYHLDVQFTGSWAICSWHIQSIGTLLTICDHVEWKFVGTIYRDCNIVIGIQKLYVELKFIAFS
jgi:hypothetical protein